MAMGKRDQGKAGPVIKQWKSRLFIKVNSSDVFGSNSYFIQVCDKHLSKAK